MRMVTIHGAKELTGAEGLAVRIAASRAMTDNVARAEIARSNRQSSRNPANPERQSVQKAMLLVEHRIVCALWTLARLPNDRGIGYAKRNGVGYFDERADLYANAIANGGWLTTAPKPAPPTGKAIDEMQEPLDWIGLLPRNQARLLTVGAQAKRGDVSRNINWPRLRHGFPEFHDFSTRTLQRRYQDALRAIVAELAVGR